MIDYKNPALLGQSRALQSQLGSEVKSRAIPNGGKIRELCKRRSNDRKREQEAA